jgi:hypothetical protein
MIVEKLIEKLQEMDPTANVVFEDPRDDSCWTVREAVDDDTGSFVMLLRGKRLPVRTDDEEQGESPAGGDGNG